MKSFLHHNDDLAISCLLLSDALLFVIELFNSPRQ